MIEDLDRLAAELFGAFESHDLDRVASMPATGAVIRQKGCRVRVDDEGLIVSIDEYVDLPDLS